ncbi:hypothetical protein Nepgr_015838 [Nepenthes gracilis]|uniref:Uncharacterized protein n=1 Tax=Nepenthes gracilis TaxID=150966 RepID=A0AAD3SNZ3_NEPGR|nr:hypothetical protein Nepgr_015838 [Nepenthes gracilis]
MALNMIGECAFAGGAVALFDLKQMRIFDRLLSHDGMLSEAWSLVDGWSWYSWCRLSILMSPVCFLEDWFVPHLVFSENGVLLSCGIPWHLVDTLVPISIHEAYGCGQNFFLLGFWVSWMEMSRLGSIAVLQWMDDKFCVAPFHSIYYKLPLHLFMESVQARLIFYSRCWRCCYVTLSLVRLLLWFSFEELVGFSLHLAVDCVDVDV